MPSEGINRTIEDNKEESEGADFSDGEISNIIDDKERRKLQNKIRSRRYRARKRDDAKVNTQIPKLLTDEEEEKIIRRKERSRQNSRRYRDRKRANNVINLEIEQSSKTTVKSGMSTYENFHDSEIAGPSTSSVQHVPTHTAGLLIKNESNISELYADYDHNICDEIPLEVQIDQDRQIHVRDTSNILPSVVESNRQSMVSEKLNIPLDDVKIKIEVDNEEAVRTDFSDGDVSQNIIDEEEKERLQNEIRCRQYRAKKRADTEVNSQISKPLTIQEEEKQSSKTVIRFVPQYQNIVNSEIPGPSSSSAPDVPYTTTHTADLSIKSEPHISELNSGYDHYKCNDIPLEIPIDNVPQMHVLETHVAEIPNILPSVVEYNKQSVVFQNLVMSLDSVKREIEDSNEEVVRTDYSDADLSQNVVDEEEKKRLQNKIRCRRYRAKKRAEAKVNSQIHNPLTVKEEEKELSKIVVRLVPEYQNFLDSEIVGPLPSSVPDVPYTTTYNTGLSIKHEPYISESNSGHDHYNYNEIPLGIPINHVPQIHVLETHVAETPNSFPSAIECNKQSIASQKLMMSLDSVKKEIEDNTEEVVRTDFSDADSTQNVVDEEEKKRLQNKIRCRRYRAKKRAEAKVNSQIPKPVAVVEEDKQLSKIVVKLVPQYQNFFDSEIAGSLQSSVPHVPYTTTNNAGLSIKKEPCITELNYNCNNIPSDAQIDDVQQMHVLESHVTEIPNILPSIAGNNTQRMISQKLEMHSEVVKINIEYDNKAAVRTDLSDADISQNRIDEEEKKRLQNKIRCRRYRAKKRADAKGNSQNLRPLTIEEEAEMNKRRKEINRQKSRLYRDRIRAYSVINLQTEQLSKIVERHDSNCQNVHDTEVGGLSTRTVPHVPTHVGGPSSKKESVISELESNYDICNEIPLEIQIDQIPQIHVSNILPSNVESNVQSKVSQLNPSGPYSSFQQNSSAHREFHKDFYDNEFGHTCDICDRLWFRKELKTFVNNDKTYRIELIRKILTNVNAAEVKVCYTCLASFRKNRVPPLSVYNGFKYPPFPENLKKYPLDLVTERLISPKIPFKQIRIFRHIHGQSAIYDRVINVPVEVNTMVHTLPRDLDDDYNIAIHIKSRKIHKSSFLHSKDNRRKIKAWLQYLKDTPLYTFSGITVDDSFLNSEDPVKDEDANENLYESLIVWQQTLIWDDEMYLTIVPGEGNDPMNILFDEHAEELSFPHIYLGQLRTFRYSVTPLMMATSEVRRSDRRGVTRQHLLYMAMKIMRVRISDALTIASKQGWKRNTITKEQIKSQDYIDGCFESDLAFLRAFPNSPYYWSERKKDLFAMIRQHGKPTVLFTISANEIGWPKLLQLLYNLKNTPEISVEDAAALNFVEKNTLVNEDAVTCALYFNKLVNVLLKTLQSKRFSPFKKYRILYYFKRIEFQYQGTQAHIFAWLDNAPKDPLGRDYNETVDLINFLISVSAPEASGNIKLQTHKHSFTCFKGSTSKSMQKCRFEAPFMPIKTTMILTPMKDTENGFEEYKAKYNVIRRNLENYEYYDYQTFYEDNNIESDQEYVNIIRAGITRPKVFPNRQPYEKWYNPFNPFLLYIVKSCTNFQFILDDYSLGTHVVEYVNKTDRGVRNLQKKIIEIMDKHPEFDIFDIAKNISVDLLNHTEITCQEAAWYLLKEPIAKSSTNIVYIPTVWPNKRQRIKKPMKELNESKDDCTDILWKENWFDKYEKRPKELEDITLAQFVSKYYKNAKGKYVERDEPIVIRYRNYDMTADFNEYRREMVTLHIPFRNEETEILKEMKFITIYDENVDLILQKRKEFESDINIEEILEICRELCHEEALKNNEEMDVVDPLSDQKPSQELKSVPKVETDDLQSEILNPQSSSNTN